MIFLFTIESRLLEKRRDSLVDRIFNDKFGETAGKGQIARLDGIKRKRVVFISVCLPSGQSRAQLHELRRSKIPWQIAVKESPICK